MPRPRSYLNNKDLSTQLRLSNEQGEMTDELVKMLMMLVERYATRSNFVGYSFNDDMQSHALLLLVRKWDKFDAQKSDNPFAFFTQTIKNSFIQYLNMEKKHRDLRDELLLSEGMNPSWSYDDGDADGTQLET